MTKALKERLLASTVEDRFFAENLAALLRKNGRPSAQERVEVVDHLGSLAAAAAEEHPRLSRHFERERAAWLAGDTDAINAARERIARAYIAEADSRLEADPDGGAMVAGLFLEKAIATLRLLPRSYRVANGVEDLIGALRDRLQVSRETTLENMMRIDGGSIDLTDAVTHARERVSGHTTRFEALALFATLVPPLDAARVRADAESLVEGSVSHIFGSATFSHDGRKVAAREGSTRGPNNPAVEDEIVRHVAIHAEITAQGSIFPALDVLMSEHRYDRAFITALCVDSPTVPEGHASLWGAGLAVGLTGDFGPAVAVLVPQLEQVVRTLLKSRGVRTLFVDEQTGVESEKSLNALLEMNEAAEVLGAGVVMELRALPVVHGGPNLRNEMAHGLVDDAAAWSYYSMYVWWFCLRLVVVPVVQMVNQRAQQTAEGMDEGGNAAGGDVPKPNGPAS